MPDYKIKFTEQSKKNITRSYEDQGFKVEFKDTHYSEIAIITDGKGKKIVTLRASRKCS